MTLATTFASLDWGNVAEWASAVAGGGALMIALVVLRAESNERREAALARREEARRERQRDARRVSFDVQFHSRPNKTVGAVQPHEAWVSFSVSNDSDAAIKDVSFVAILVCGPEGERAEFVDWLPSLGKGEPWTNTHPAQPVAGTPRAESRATLEFTDSAGLRWSKDRIGNLKEVP